MAQRFPPFVTFNRSIKITTDLVWGNYFMGFCSDMMAHLEARDGGSTSLRGVAKSF
jgi:hypothetical protein